MTFTSQNKPADGSINDFNENGSEKRCELSKRELEILELTADEYTAAEIAKKLFVSFETVETHKRNIIKKWGVHNTVGAVVKAMRRGLIK